MLTDREAALLVRRAGGTPVYAYSRTALARAVERVRAASPVGCRIFFSLKANPHIGVVSTLRSLVDGFDVCSLVEMETALNAGAPAQDILFTGPAKSMGEMAAALAASITVTIESPGQARLFVEQAKALGVVGRAVIRVNGPYPARNVTDAPMPNQFGVGDDDLPEVVNVLRTSSSRIEGLHMFWGSQHADSAVIRAARAAVMERVRAISSRYDLACEMIAIGGGIAMPWCSGDPEVDWDGLTVGTAETFASDEQLRTVVCEYGRSIAGPAGVLLTTVLDVKTIDGRRYVLVDAGMNHAMLASRLVAGGDRGEPAVRVLAPEEDDCGRAWVTGPLCSQLDVLAADVPLATTRIGDLVMFSGVGAYGPTFSPSGFLSRDAVREIVY